MQSAFTVLENSIVVIFTIIAWLSPFVLAVVVIDALTKKPKKNPLSLGVEPLGKTYAVTQTGDENDINSGNKESSKIKTVLRKTGFSLWAGLLANVFMAAVTTFSIVSLAQGETIHDGMEALAIIFAGLYIAAAGLTLSIIDLIKRRWWGLAGLVLSLTPAPICLALMYFLMQTRQIRPDF